MALEKKTAGNRTPRSSFTAHNLNLPSPPVANAKISINNCGQIVGTVGAPGFEQAFLWQPDSPNFTSGKYYALPTAAGCTSYAVDISDCGDIAGYMMDLSGNMAQVIWRAASNDWIPLPPPLPPLPQIPKPPTKLPQAINSNRSNSVPLGQLNAYGGINNSRCVGINEFDAAGNSVRATFFPGQKPIVELRPDFWGARAINNKGQIVGHASAPSPNNEQPVRWCPDDTSPWSPGTYTRFLTATDSHSLPTLNVALLEDAAATDVNDKGDAVVGGNHPAYPFSPVIIWREDNSCIDLTPALKTIPNILPISENLPCGINNADPADLTGELWVVGTLDTSLAFLCTITFTNNGTVWVVHTVTAQDLSTAVPNSTFGVANDVNDSQHIVVTGVVNGVAGVYLLT